MNTTTIPAAKLAEVHAALKAAEAYTRFSGAAPNDRLYLDLMRAAITVEVYLLAPLKLEVSCST